MYKLGLWPPRAARPRGPVPEVKLPTPSPSPFFCDPTTTLFTQQRARPRPLPAPFATNGFQQTMAAEYSPEVEVAVKRIKAMHKETTASAQRAVQVRAAASLDHAESPSRAWKSRQPCPGTSSSSTERDQASQRRLSAGGGVHRWRCQRDCSAAQQAGGAAAGAGGGHGAGARRSRERCTPAASLTGAQG